MKREELLKRERNIKSSSRPLTIHSPCGVAVVNSGGSEQNVIDVPISS